MATPQEILAGLQARGVPLHVAQGIVTGMRAESGLNPGINEIKPVVPGSRGGYGLNQWTGPRRVAYETFAKERGLPLDSLDAQLDFTMHEFKGPESRAWAALQGAKTPEEAAKLYETQFLRPGIPHGGRGRETLSTSGLLNEAPQMDEPQQGPLGGLLGIKRDTSKINDLGLALMALSSPRAAPAFMQMAQGRREEAAGRRKEREEAGRANRTVEWLAQQPGGQQFAALAEALGPQAAVQAYMQAQKGQDPTALQQNVEWLMAQGMGRDEAIAAARGGTSVNVNTGSNGQNIGTIPQGYTAVPDPSNPSGFRMEAIPGGPEDRTGANEVKAGNAATVTETVTSAAQRAREAAGTRALGGVGQGIVAAINPYSDSREVQRQVDVLKSVAKIGNLQAMRDASPTGGALGAVTAPELQMLSDKSGALDPSSQHFARDLDDYERTLLRVIHGPEIGDQIFEQTRTQPAATGGGDDDLFKKYGIAP